MFGGAVAHMIVLSLIVLLCFEPNSLRFFLRGHVKLGALSWWIGFIELNRLECAPQSSFTV